MISVYCIELSVLSRRVDCVLKKWSYCGVLKEVQFLSFIVAFFNFEKVHLRQSNFLSSHIKFTTSKLLPKTNQLKNKRDPKIFELFHFLYKCLNSSSKSISY